MNLVVLILFCAGAVFTFPLPLFPDGQSSSALQLTTTLPSNQETIGDVIRHNRRRKKGKIGNGRKKRRRLKNNSTSMYAEKQFLVHNRTLALLGDQVQKILLNNKAIKVNQPYESDGTIDAKDNSSSVIIGFKISQARNASQEKGDLKDKTNFNYDLDINSFTDELQVQFVTAVVKLLGTSPKLKNAQLDDINTPCKILMDCRNHMRDIFLGPLPSCPCIYPTNIFYKDQIWDDQHNRYYRWKDASSPVERLEIYKPTAELCIRSLLHFDSTTLAAQQCCYNRERKLITRGSGAGNPNYISPDVSRSLHEKLDLLPWKLCNGDFTRFNKIRPPNNGNKCEENPKKKEFEKQILQASLY